MAVSFTSTFPANGATQVDTLLSVSTALEINLETDASLLDPTSINVTINGLPVITNGADVSGSGFSSIFTATSTTIKVEIFFSDITDRFDSFGTVVVAVTASDDVPSSFSGSFTFRMEDRLPPVISDIAPALGSDDNAPDTPIFVRITDQGSGADESTLLLTINVEEDAVITGFNAIIGGVIQSGFNGTVNKVGTNIDVLLFKDDDYGSNAEVTATVQVQDENPANLVDAYTQFRILDVDPPTIVNLVPAANATNVSETSTITLAFKDENGSGVDLSTVNIKIDGFYAVKDGALQFPFLDGSSQILTVLFPSSTNVETATFILKTSADLPSASRVRIEAFGKDNRRNEAERFYSFVVRDHLPPQIEKTFPADGDEHILPRTDIRFKLIEDPDGYGINFESLLVEIDGYSIANQTHNGVPVDGYFDDYIGRDFKQAIIDGYIITPKIEEDGYVLYPGFDTTIDQESPGTYAFIVNPLTDFPFEYDVSVRINVEDRGGLSNSELYFFRTAAEDEIITTAFPDTGTYKDFIDGYGLKEAYKFLSETGVTLTTNLPDTITFYTTDGSVPRIDSCNKVLGTTQVFTKPILIQKENLNVIKFFSIDSAGTAESIKQEVYMIDLLPPEPLRVTSVPIVADIPFATTVVPVETTALFQGGQLVKILDDARPPILTRILTLNETSNPSFLIVEDAVEKLKVSRGARVEITEQPINRQEAIDFDTTSISGDFYIGSNGEGKEQSDAVFEQFRILNTASTDEEILADFTLLNKGSRFFNQDTEVILSSEFSDLEKERVNLPDKTLVLLDLDGNVLNKDRRGVLTNNSTPIVDTFAAANDIIFTIKIKEGEVVDRELLREVLTDFAPADLNIIVRFEEIS